MYLFILGVYGVYTRCVWCIYLYILGVHGVYNCIY